MGCINQKPKKSNISINNPLRGQAQVQGKQNIDNPKTSNVSNSGYNRNMSSNKEYFYINSSINKGSQSAEPQQKLNISNSNGTTQIPMAYEIQNHNEQKGRYHEGKKLTVETGDNFRNVSQKIQKVTEHKQPLQQEKENLGANCFYKISASPKNEDSDLKPILGRMPGALINESNNYLAHLNVPYPQPQFGWVKEICDENYQLEIESVNIPNVKFQLD